MLNTVIKGWIHGSDQCVCSVYDITPLHLEIKESYEAKAIYDPGYGRGLWGCEGKHTYDILS